jgi:hypothetical protein
VHAVVGSHFVFCRRTGCRAAPSAVFRFPATLLAHPPVSLSQLPGLASQLPPPSHGLQAEPVLCEVQALVRGQLGALKRLGGIKGLVEHLQCGAPLPGVGSGGGSSRYMLEWLDLGVR